MERHPANATWNHMLSSRLIKNVAGNMVSIWIMLVIFMIVWFCSENLFIFIFLLLSFPLPVQAKHEISFLVGCVECIQRNRPVPDRKSYHASRFKFSHRLVNVCLLHGKTCI